MKGFYCKCKNTKEIVDVYNQINVDKVFGEVNANCVFFFMYEKIWGNSCCLLR